MRSPSTLIKRKVKAVKGIGIRRSDCRAHSAYVFTFHCQYNAEWHLYGRLVIAQCVSAQKNDFLSPSLMCHTSPPRAVAAVTRNIILGVCHANGALNDLPSKICSSYLLTLSTSNTSLTSARCLRLLGPQANYKSTLLSLTYFVKKFFVLFSLSQTNRSSPSGGYFYQLRNRCSKQVGLAGVTVGQNMMTRALHSADLHPSSWKAFQKSAPSFRTCQGKA